jgi:hypothetical protein
LYKNKYLSVNLHVFNEVMFLFVPGTAEVAHVCDLELMCEHVLGEGGLLAEPLVAEVAGVRVHEGVLVLVREGNHIIVLHLELEGILFGTATKTRRQSINKVWRL